MDVRVGTVFVDAAAPSDTHTDPAAAARTAEQAGLDSLWAGDHLMVGEVPVLDAMLALAAAAGATERIELGLGAFIPSLRPLAWAAKQVATLAQIAAPRRLHLGVAAGAGPSEEYLAAGADRSARGRRSDTFLAALPRLLSGQPVDLDGVAVHLVPPAPMPTLWVGGSSTVALRRCVRFDAGWLAGLLTVEEFRRTGARLTELAETAGRPRPRLGLVTPACVAADAAFARERTVALLRRAFGLDADRAEALAIAGSASQVAEQLAGYAVLGVEQIALLPVVTPWSRSCANAAQVRDELRSL